MRSGWEWTFLRYCLGLAWIATSIRVAIPDYPYGSSYWDFLILDKGGLQHELAYIAAIFISLITLTYFWELLSIMRNGKGVLKLVLKRVEKDL